MTLYIDKLQPNDLGGSTTDKRKAEYILAKHGLSFEKILGQTPKSTPIPSGAFMSGKYIVVFNLSWDLMVVNFGFINHEVDLDENFDIFADSMSPKAVAAFHRLKEQIKQRPPHELNKTELSDDDSDFEIAYSNYKSFQHRQ